MVVQVVSPGKVTIVTNQANSLSHTKWMRKYHIVITLKDRRKLIDNQYRKSLEEMLRKLCRYKGVNV